MSEFMEICFQLNTNLPNSPLFDGLCILCTAADLAEIKINTVYIYLFFPMLSDKHDWDNYGWTTFFPDFLWNGKSLLVYRQDGPVLNFKIPARLIDNINKTTTISYDIIKRECKIEGSIFTSDPDPRWELILNLRKTFLAHAARIVIKDLEISDRHLMTLACQYTRPKMLLFPSTYPRY